MASSLPTRERGLKCVRRPFHGAVDQVAPHAGAWIEIPGSNPGRADTHVAPHAGAWIEISCHQADLQSGESLPTRERGLK